MARRRVLQFGFLAVAVALVVIADLTADGLATLSAGPLAPFVAVGGRVAGGFAVGMACRLQDTRRSRPDPGLRLLLGLPCAALAGVPVLLAAAPGAAAASAGVVVELQRLAPFAGAMLGIILALAVRPTRR